MMYIYILRVLISAMRACSRRSAVDGRRRLVVLEGFMLYFDPVLVELMDLRLWLELTYTVAKERRMSTTPMPHEQYDKCLWPNYCCYKDISVWGCAQAGSTRCVALASHQLATAQRTST